MRPRSTPRPSASSSALRAASVLGVPRRTGLEAAPAAAAFVVAAVRPGRVGKGSGRGREGRYQDKRNITRRLKNTGSVRKIAAEFHVRRESVAGVWSRGTLELGRLKKKVPGDLFMFSLIDSDATSVVPENKLHPKRRGKATTLLCEV